MKFSLLILTAACGIAHASTSARAFEFSQGVIVDALLSIVYMSNSEAGIDAFKLSNGEVIATSTHGTKPLLLYDDVLLAEAKDKIDVLSIVGLTTKDLKPKFAVDLSLPDQIRTGSFYANASIESNEIIVQWRSIQRPMSAIPTREPAHVRSGFARIDPATGRPIAAGEGEPSVPPTPQAGIPVIVQKLVDDGALATPLCQVDDLIAALQYVEENGGIHMTLRRWNKDTGESLPVVSVFGGELTFRSFSRDCRNMLASKPADGWIWHIYSIVTGEQIAEIHNSLPAAEFFISGENLIYESPAVGDRISGRLRIDPPRLVAIDLNTGRELWARPIGEPAYVGPFPAGNPPDRSMQQMGSGHK
jgi:hypothetical protein